MLYSPEETKSTAVRFLKMLLTGLTVGIFIRWSKTQLILVSLVEVGYLIYLFFSLHWTNQQSRTAMFEIWTGLITCLTLILRMASLASDNSIGAASLLDDMQLALYYLTLAVCCCWTTNAYRNHFILKYQQHLNQKKKEKARVDLETSPLTEERNLKVVVERKGQLKDGHNRLNSQGT